jgi:hypothetical protein
MFSSAETNSDFNKSEASLYVRPNLLSSEDIFI